MPQAPVQKGFGQPGNSMEAAVWKPELGWDLKDVHPTPFICHLDIVSSVKPRDLPKVTQQASGGGGGTDHSSPRGGGGIRGFFSRCSGNSQP